MKFQDKFKKFKINLESSEKYQVFLKKSDFYHHKLSHIFLKKLRLKYFFALMFYSKPVWWNLFKWGSNIIVDGFLVYVAITGIFNMAFAPLTNFHKIFAYGLAVYIPGKLIKKAYEKISYERGIRNYPQQMQEVLRNK